MAKRVKQLKTTGPDSDATSDDKLHQYESLFEELVRFTNVIDAQEFYIQEAKVKVEEAKAKYDDEREQLRQLEQIRDGAKHNLYRFLKPKNGAFQFMPLFDKMEEADTEVHGKNCTEWRQEPIAALKLSLPSLQSLADADIVMVGQLQDRVLKSPKEWWTEINGLTAGSAEAIVDRLNDFIFEATK